MATRCTTPSGRSLLCATSWRAEARSVPNSCREGLATSGGVAGSSRRRSTSWRSSADGWNRCWLREPERGSSVRGNHGGSGARFAAAMFLSGEAVFRATYRDGRNVMMMADTALRLPDEYQLPIAIAVDAGTWSASEIFAFGLRQYGRATVVGERTAGFVGSIDAIELSGEARVGVKAQHVTGPNGEMYNGVGVKPDIETTSADAVDAAARFLREE